VSKTAFDRSQTLIRVLDLPGVRDLENYALLYRENPDRVADRADQLCEKLFGVTENDTLFEAPDDYDEIVLDSAEWKALQIAWDRHEERYEVQDDLTDDEVMELAKSFGFDFSDERGNPIRSTKMLARVAEAAAKNYAGHMPNSDAARLDRWGEALEKQREEFIKARKR
jgi:hypothetical protein